MSPSTVESKTRPVLPDAEDLYEVVNGERVETPPMGVRETILANRLNFQICSFSQPKDLGEGFVEMLFRLRTSPKLEWRPDVGFVPYERWPDRIVPDIDAWEMIPALAAEFISKTNTAENVEEKIEEYFENGVSLVWVIFPRQQKAYIYESPKSVRVLDRNDVLEGGSVLPGFQLPVSELL